MDNEPQGGSDAEGTPLWEDSSLEVAEQTTKSSTSTKAPSRESRFPRLTKKQTYTILAIFLLLGVAVGSLMLLKHFNPAQDEPNSIVINTQSLDNGTLNELTAGSEGAVRQQLTITPDTIFKNNVEIQDSASIKNDLTVGGKAVIQGAVTLNDALTVSRSLTIGNNAAIAGNLSVNGLISAASLTVGALTISSISLSSDLVFAGHIVPNGGSPTARASVAASGGSVSISGNDTAGTVTINVGGGTRVGEMAIINFGRAFTGTPKVQLTPINDRASTLNYYASRSPGFFTINTSSAPVSGGSYVFDYLVTQ